MPPDVREVMENKMASEIEREAEQMKEVMDGAGVKGAAPGEKRVLSSEEGVAELAGLGFMEAK